MMPKRLHALPLTERNASTRGSRMIDRTGQRFNFLVGVQAVGKNKWGNVIWRFACDCGGSIDTEAKSVTKGLTKTCGCGIDATGATDLDRSNEAMVGRRVGLLLVRSACDVPFVRRRLWDCICDCGRMRRATTQEINTGTATHCGHWSHVERDIAGQRFGKLTAIRRLSSVRWLFMCDCGNEKRMPKSHALQGGTRSCGCLVRLGADRPTASLSWQQVDEILEACKTPYYGIGADLAKKYGVSQGTICQIRLGRIYKRAVPL